MWTQFWDMRSGGGLKEDPYHFIYIEAPQEEAELVFYNRFGHNPSRVSCTCCGEDYSVNEDESLEQLTGYHRNCYCDDDGMYQEKVGDISSNRYPVYYIPLEEYIQQKNVLIIRANEIKDSQRVGELPTQGYVWC